MRKEIGAAEPLPLLQRMGADAPLPLPLKGTAEPPLREQGPADGRQPIEGRAAEPLLRVMALHSLAYCERLYYLEEVEGQLVADEAVHDGRRLHEELVEGPLTSFALEAPGVGLRGKVDVVCQREGAVIPIEVKKGRCAARPGSEAAWLSDRIQVGAYALLLEETQGITITEGRVRYLESNKTIRIPMDEALRAAVRERIARARALRLQVVRPPVTDNERLCPRCSLAPVCLPEEERRAQQPERQAVRLFPPHCDRTVVHVLEHGAYVGRDGDRLTVRIPQEGIAPQSYPIHQVESVLVHGNAQMSTQALRMCCDHEVSVFWVTSSGRVLGGLQPVGQGAQRHLRQFEALRDEQERLRLSRLLVSAKVDAQLHFLQRGLRGDGRPEGLEILARIRRSLREVESAPDAATLLGLEGSAAAAYFEGLRLLLKPDLDDRLRFVRRSQHPAVDRFNALLNYGYGMLQRQVQGAIVSVGLHTGVGFYHQPRTSAPPLVLDLMELFRVPLVDMPLVAALNRNTFHPVRDFEGPGALSQEGRAKAIEVFERRKQDEWKHSVLGYSLSWPRIIELEARLLEKELGGEGKLFAQFRLR